MILVCSGCVLNTNAPTEQPIVDDGSIRVAPLRLTLDDGVAPVVLEDLLFATPSPFERRNDSLPFDHAGHHLVLEAGQIANMAAVGGQVGLTIDGHYTVVSLSRHDASQPDERWESRVENVALEFDFSLDGRVVHATLELSADYHCPPYPTAPATPENDGPPAVSGTPL